MLGAKGPKAPMPPELDELDPLFANPDFLVPDDPRSSGYMVAIHTDFYRWAKPLAEGCRVVDAGCGSGYGTAILAESASWALGVDIKPGLVRYARKRYVQSNLRFSVMDGLALGLAPSSVDIVICNEFIEHLPDYRPFLEDAYRVLRPGGRLVCATTNANRSFKKRDGSPLNRNHFHEFTGETLLDLLGSKYSTIESFSQLPNPAYMAFAAHGGSRLIERCLMTLRIKHRIPVRWRNKVRQLLTGISVEMLVEGEFAIVQGLEENGLYAIVVATKGALDGSAD